MASDFAPMQEPPQLVAEMEMQVDGRLEAQGGAEADHELNIKLLMTSKVRQLAIKPFQLQLTKIESSSG